MQIEAINTFLIIVGAHMDTLLIIKVRFLRSLNDQIGQPPKIC